LTGLAATYVIGMLLAWFAIAKDIGPDGKTVGWLVGFVLSFLWPILVTLNVGLTLMRLGLRIRG